MLLLGLLPAIAAPAWAKDGVAREAALRARPIITIPRIDRAPKLEEFLGMAPALGAPKMAKIDNFVQLQPKDGAPAQEKTDVYIGYDAKNFYAVFVCFDKDPHKIRNRMTHREDLSPSTDDEVQVYLDTFNDKQRAYGFMTNPSGIQLDYIWTEQQGYDLSWDTVWDSYGKQTDKGYVAMFSIPFKSLRFPSSQQQTWGILFQRVIPHDNDNSFEPWVSSSIQGRLNQEAPLEGLSGISPGRNIQLNPYGVLDAFRDLDERDPNNPSYLRNHLGARVGLDGKMIVHDSLVLDFTVNPDFRQLESDQPQNTVNQRFEVFFPEKRPFFQEGANFFQTPFNLYFTRRILNPQFGARLTGKVGPWGIGLLSSDDQGPGLVVPTYDPLSGKRAYFNVARITRDLWKQSYVGIFYSDREFPGAAPAANTLCFTTAPSTTEQFACTSHSNRVAGADFTFHFGPNFWLNGQALTSTTDEAGGLHMSGQLYNSYAEYSTRHIEENIQLSDTDAGFLTLMGFFHRPDVLHESNYFRYLFKPEGKVLTDWGPYDYQRVEFDHQGVQLDTVTEVGLNIDLKASTNIQPWKGFSQEVLRPFDFSSLPGNKRYKEGYWGFFLNNSYFKLVTFNTVWNWNRTPNFDPPGNTPPFLTNELSGNLTLSVHPWNPLSIDNSYILERLTTRTNPSHGIVNANVIRSKWTYQYNPRLSVRTIFQYNAEIVNPLYTADDHPKIFNTDFLITYLVHPGTAFYLGYNSNLENLNALDITDHVGLVRTNRSYINDGRTIFGKVSWLFRF